MNKPTKITPPSGGDNENDADKRRETLFERASGAFGLNALNPARVPAKLPQGKGAQRMPMPAPAEVISREEPEIVPAPPAAVEAAMPASPVRRVHRETAGPAVSFTGTRHAVSRSHLVDQGLIDPDGGASTLLEEFRIVKRQVLDLAEQGGNARSRRVLICSPHTGEGKTFCATNLAISLAGERDSEVLLIDADFAKPSIMRTFGLDDGPGLMDALADPSIEIEDLVVGTDIPGLWLLPAGDRTSGDSE
ncbi:MAG: hypothetical protein ACR2FJ_08535 [Qipengyuania sp.]